MSDMQEVLRSMPDLTRYNFFKKNIFCVEALAMAVSHSGETVLCLIWCSIRQLPLFPRTGRVDEAKAFHLCFFLTLTIALF